MWPKLVGKKRRQPATGNWHDWKQDVADHCEGCCIYCAISEARFGGIRNFHVEHFRPKSRFRALENKVANLYLACGICNVLKCDDWPAEPKADHSVAAYPDPFVSDYNAVFTVRLDTYEVASDFAAGRYVIERVLLNRAQLVIERRVAVAMNRFEEFRKWVQTTQESMTPDEAKRVSGILSDIVAVQLSILRARPYKDTETKRPARPKARRKRSSS